MRKVIPAKMLDLAAKATNATKTTVEVATKNLESPTGSDGSLDLQIDKILQSNKSSSNIHKVN